MSHPMHRLEELLRLWERVFFIDGALAQRGSLIHDRQRVPYVGPLRHWQSLRAHLLQVGGGAMFDYDRFSMRDAALQRIYPSFRSFPYCLAAWTASSRRIFHLSEELQALLMGMSFGQMRWQDILLPFDSFVIALERSIRCDDENFDAVLVVRVRHDDPNQEGITLRLINQSVQDFQPLSDLDRRAWISAIQKGKSIEDKRRALLRGTEGATSIETAVTWQSLEHHLLTTSFSQGGGSTAIKNYVGETSFSDEGVAKAMNVAFRFVAGLCLYLVSLPSSSPHRSDWQPGSASGKPDPRSIMQTSRVCDVTSCYTLTSEERNVFCGDGSVTGREMCVHFRRGHFRRAPGTGDDPTAPKVVLVKPMLIREDRLADGAIPGGSLTRVK